MPTVDASWNEFATKRGTRVPVRTSVSQMSDMYAMYLFLFLTDNSAHGAYTVDLYRETCFGSKLAPSRFRVCSFMLLLDSPTFRDGVISLAIDDAVDTYNALYFTAAGNDGLGLHFTSVSGRLQLEQTI